MVRAANSTIYFTAKLLRIGADATIGVPASLALAATGGEKVPSENSMVEGTLNGFPFRTPFERTGDKGHSLKLSEGLLEALGAKTNEPLTVEITRIGNELEPRRPIELLNALAAEPKARAMWEATTPSARRDWILWITSAKQTETRLIRIEKACSMLASGKKRVCCFGGLNWLTKDHPKVDTWLPLPKAGK